MVDGDCQPPRPRQPVSAATMSRCYSHIYSHTSSCAAARKPATGIHHHADTVPLPPSVPPPPSVPNNQALLGPSGAGKSTLMDILAQRKSMGNLSGFLLVDGQPATSSFIRKTAYVPQVRWGCCRQGPALGQVVAS